MFDAICAHNSKVSECQCCNDPGFIANADYFALLGLEKTTRLNKELLDKNYFAMQKIFHPDKITILPKAAQQILATYSERLNQGYKILNDKFSQYQYLMTLHGFDLNDERQTNNNIELLEEIMAKQEAIMEAGPEQLLELTRIIHFDLDKTYLEFELGYEQKNYKKCFDYLVKIKYLNMLSMLISNK